jgi:hypothetical protein
MPPVRGIWTRLLGWMPRRLTFMLRLTLCRRDCPPGEVVPIIRAVCAGLRSRTSEKEAGCPYRP